MLNAKESCGAAVSRNIRGLWGIWIKPANCCPTKLKPKIYKVCCVTSAAGYVLLQQWGEGEWMLANFGGVRAELAFARTWGWCLNCGNDQRAAVLSVNIKMPLSEEPAHNAPVWSEKRADQIKQQHCLLGFVVVITCILYGSWGGCGLCSRALRASVADCCLWTGCLIECTVASLPLDAADVWYDHEAQASHAGDADDVGKGNSATPTWLWQWRRGGQWAGNMGTPASTHGDGQDARCVGSCHANVLLTLWLYKGLQREMSEMSLLAWESQGHFSLVCAVASLPVEWR